MGDIYFRDKKWKKNRDNFFNVISNTTYKWEGKTDIKISYKYTNIVVV